MVKKISQEEYTDIADTAVASKELLESPKFKFLRDYLEAAVVYGKDAITHNTIHDVEETSRITDFISRTIRIPKKVQVDELVGQIKLVEKFFHDLQYNIDTKADLDKEIAQQRIKVDDGREVRQT